ncbi:unnamed protein product [Adineta steineri]|uniref:Uncharacterized protein n=1 Tax=Adineta steineri TaxID=433720 RepID=A0A815M422_9BILA|nr:unnamed protein product [Adineta steineri]
MRTPRNDLEKFIEFLEADFANTNQILQQIQYDHFNDLIHRNEYEKLESILIYDFTKELTFILNTLLFLSPSNYMKSFHLNKCPRLLDLPYGHIGLILSSDTLINDHYLKSLYDNIWSKHLNYRIDSLWLESCSFPIDKLLLNIDNDQNMKTNLYKKFFFFIQI